MARQPLDQPSPFGLLVSQAIRRELGDRRMSGRELARRLDRSESYVRDRLNDKFEFTLSDIERFAALVDQDPAHFVASLTAPSNVTPIRRRDVGSSTEDLPRVARKRDEDTGEDADAP